MECALQTSTGMNQPRLEDEPTKSHGQLLGHYRLGAVLGVGGMASVHEAVDVRSGKRVAVKVLSPSSRGSSEVVARFVREGRALERLRHANIVRVLDHGVSPSGAPWIAMERLNGPSLGALIATGPLSAARALRLMTGVAKALASVHAHGAVHRDVKPDNIVVVHAGTPEEQAKLIDFGIAHVAAEDIGENSVEYTRFGAILGSVPFMAPEYLAGTTREASPTADVFSFAVSLYEALTGRMPFEGETIREQLDARRRGAVASVRTHVGGRAHAAFDAFFARALSVVPAKRPSDGAALLEELASLGSSVRRASASSATIRLDVADRTIALRAGAPVGRTAPSSAPPPGGIGHGAAVPGLGTAVFGGVAAGSLLAIWLFGVVEALRSM